MVLSWIGSHNGILALAITALAATLSLANTMLNRRYRRQDAYLKMHDLLTTPEMQRGRKLVSQIGLTGKIPAPESDERAAVNRALVAHSNLAMFIHRGVISKRWVLGAWHHTLRDLNPGAAIYIDHRREVHGWGVYAELEQLIEDAVNYKSKEPCCERSAKLVAEVPQASTAEIES
jgi:hypothetical protein